MCAPWELNLGLWCCWHLTWRTRCIVLVPSWCLNSYQFNISNPTVHQIPKQASTCFKDWTGGGGNPLLFGTYLLLPVLWKPLGKRWVCQWWHRTGGELITRLHPANHKWGTPHRRVPWKPPWQPINSSNNCAQCTHIRPLERREGAAA